jgi:hypothetical protein
LEGYCKRKQFVTVYFLENLLLQVGSEVCVLLVPIKLFTQNQSDFENNPVKNCVKQLGEPVSNVIVVQ